MGVAGARGPNPNDPHGSASYRDPATAPQVLRHRLCAPVCPPASAVRGRGGGGIAVHIGARGSAQARANEVPLSRTLRAW